MGDELYVWVSTDKFNHYKWKKCVIPFKDRIRIISSLGCVDNVFAESGRDQKESDIISYNIDILVMWDDWEWKFDHLKELCWVVYLPRTANISTSEIKERIKSWHGI